VVSFSVGQAEQERLGFGWAVCYACAVSYVVKLLAAGLQQALGYINLL
jgi:hypothetical protein